MNSRKGIEAMPSAAQARTEGCTRVINSEADPRAGAGDAVLLPDGGGATAWTQVAIAHLALFNTFGWINSYGIFQQYYTSELGLSESVASWTGSVQPCLVAFVGVLSGRLFDAGHLRLCVAVGSLLQVVGVFSASAVSGGQYWQLVLGQGVCSGLGAGLLYCPVVSNTAAYFPSRGRALAIALASGGGATGGLVFPLIAQQLPPQIGFPWTIRVMGFVMLFNAFVTVAFVRSRLPPRSSGPLVEWAAFKELPYLFYVLGEFLLLWCVYLIYNFINPYGESVLGMDRASSLNMLLIANAMGLPGRVLPALVSDAYFGPFRTLVVLAMASGVLYFGWIGITNPGGLYIFAVLGGLINGGVQGIGLAGLPTLTRDLSKVGTRTGMAMTVLSMSALTGPPIGGALIDAAGGRYLYMQVWAGGIMMLGSSFVVAAHVCLKK